MADYYSGSKQNTGKTISFKLDGFEEALSQVTGDMEKAVRLAARRAISRVTVSARSLISKEIREVYNVPKKVLDERIKVFKVKLNNLQGEITIGGRSISLAYFSARQLGGKSVMRAKAIAVKNRKGQRVQRIGLESSTRKRSSSFSGVEVEVFKGKKRKLRRAWLTQFESGHVAVMQRHGRKRYPVRHKKAISVASMFSRAEVEAAVIAKIDQDLERVFLRELEYYLNRI